MNTLHKIDSVMTVRLNNQPLIFQQQEFKFYEEVIKNVRFGLANHEMRHLADAYDKVKHMKKIIDYI